MSNKQKREQARKKAIDDAHMPEGFKIADAFEDRACCTDILCLIIFLGFIGAMGYCVMYSFKHGHPDKMFRPSNGALNFCGLDNNFNITNSDPRYDPTLNLREWPLVYITRFSDGNSVDASTFTGEYAHQSGFCVKECPTKDTTTSQWLDICHDNNETSVCTSFGQEDFYNSMEFMVYCVPKSTREEDLPPTF